MRESYPHSGSQYILDDAQQAAQLRAMRREDSSVIDVRLSCSHAALYVLENSASVHWRKVGIEGFFYILKRDGKPQYRMMLKNQTDSGEGDFMHAIDDKIQFEVKEDTFFYQIGDHSIVRGLWFHDKGFMPKFVKELSAICYELGLQFDGASNGTNVPSTMISQANPAPGQAILGMLRKSDVSQQETPLNYHATPQKSSHYSSSPMEMLRHELSTSVSATPIHNVDTHLPTSRNSHKEPASYSEETFTNTGISHEDLRKVLVDMVSTDEFVLELSARLKRIMKR